MRLLQSSDVVSIHNENRYNEYDFTVSDIMSFVTSQGYNSFFLDPYYSNGSYWIRAFNATLDNGNLYLLDYEPNEDFDYAGFYNPDSSSYLDRYIVAASSTTLSIYAGMRITWDIYTYEGRIYNYFSDGISSMAGLEYEFYTTLQYDKIFVNNIDVTPIQTYTSNGGGATHIAKVTGQLKDLSSNLSDILIVSGGGGGGMLVGETEYAGADAGGISGSGDNSADQSTGYAFGQGESGADVSGGGGGLYGGYKGGTS